MNRVNWKKKFQSELEKGGHTSRVIESAKDYWLCSSGCQKDKFLFGTEVGKGQVKNILPLMNGADVLDDQTKHFCVSASYRCDFSTEDRALVRTLQRPWGSLSSCQPCDGGSLLLSVE